MENEMVCLLNNFGLLKIILRKEDYDYLDSLIKQIFPDCKKLVRKNFNIIHTK
jgi:hypothetical protein